MWESRGFIIMVLLFSSFNFCQSLEFPRFSYRGSRWGKTCMKTSELNMKLQNICTDPELEYKLLTDSSLRLSTSC